MLALLTRPHRMALWLSACTLMAPGPGAAEPVAVPAVMAPGVFGDLAEIRDRGVLRVLVTCSRTGFFVDRGRPRGFEYELMRAYERWVNRDVERHDERLRVVFVPVAWDELLPALRAGRGDVVAAGLKPPGAADGWLAATRPYLPAVPEVVVAHNGAAVPASLAELGGREVHVQAGSAQAAHLRALSRRLQARGAPPIRVTEADGRLLAEDLLQLVNDGSIELAVVDAPVARLWARALPQIEVREDLIVHGEAGVAWAVRRDAPGLLKSLNGFLAEHRRGTLLGNVLFARYYQRNRWIEQPVRAQAQASLEPLLGLFRKYGARYGFDWLALTAQAYQESRLQHEAVSPAGAVGVMQVRPSTAADPRVAIGDLQALDNNVHAGVKYLHLLREHYFDEPALTPDERLNFIWAAYNAGPTRIQRLRREAARRGLDPNRWFGNVERIAARRIGRETVDYVANINKYYLAYRLAWAGELQVASSE